MGIHFPITGDNSNFINAMRGCKKEVDKTTKTIKDSGVGIEDIFNRMKTAAMGFGAALSFKEIGQKVMQVRGEFQQLEVAFTTILGSASKAGILMEQLTRTAAVTPFGLQDVAGGAKQLLAYGLAAEEVNDTLVRLGDISAGLSLPLGDLVYLYGTTMTQGRLLTQDLHQFMGRGIPLADELAKQFGVTKDKVGELVTAGKVGFPEVQKAIVAMTAEGGKFGGLMEAQSKTIIGQISNIEDAIDSMFNEIGKSSEGVINAMLSGVSLMVENYEKIGKAIGVIVTAYGAYKAAIALHIAFKKREILVLRQAVAEKKLAAMAGISLSNAEAIAAAKTKLLTLAQQGLVKAVKAATTAMLNNPYIVIAAGVTALAVAMYDLITYQSEEEKMLEKLNDSYKDTQVEINSEISKLSRLKGELQGATIGTKEYEEAKKELINSFSKYDSNLEKELETVGLTADAYAKLTEKINESISARALAGEYSKIDENYSKTLTTSLENLYSKLTKELGDEKGAELYARIREKILAESLTLPEQGYEIGGLDEDIKALIKSTGEESFLGADYNSRQAEKYIMDIISAQNLRNRLYETARKKFGVEPAKEDGGSGEVIQETQNKKYWESLKKKYTEEYEALETIELASEKALELKKKIASVDKQIAMYDTGTKKTEKDTKARVDAQQKAEEKYLELVAGNREKEIGLYKESHQKKLLQIENNYKQEVDKINKLETEFKEQNKKAGLGGDLTSEQQTAIFDALALAEEKRLKDVAEVEDEYNKKRLDSSRAFLKKYGDYQQQRFAIASEYEEKIKEALTPGDKALLSEDMNRELEELDKRFGLTTSAMADLFEDSSDKSISAIEDIIDKYESLVEFMSGSGRVDKDKLLSLGFTDSDLQSLKTGETKIKDIADAIAKLKGELGSRSPFRKFADDIKEGIGKISSGETGEGLSKIGNAVSGFAPELKEFSSSISTIFGYEDDKIQSGISAVDGLGKTAAGVGQALSGDIVGGVMNAASGVAQVVDALDGMFGADYSEYNQLREEYLGFIDIWDELISKKSEYVDIRYGSDAFNAGEEAIDILNKEIEANKELGKARLKSGASAGSHSIAYRQKDRMSSSDWKAAADAIGWDKSNSMYDLFELSAEQLEKLKYEAPSFWNKLDDDVIEYLQNIIDCNDEIDNMGEKLQEVATGVSFDSFYDSFVSALTDMNASAEDIADSISEYFFKAMLSNFVGDKLRGRLEDFYNRWASDMEDGKVDDIQAYRDEYQRLVAEGIAERDALASVTGYGSDGDAFLQEASSKGFASMSQETADELNGRFTALQIAGEDVRANMLQVVAHLGGLSAVSAENNALLSQVRDVVITSNSFLENIDANTALMLKNFDAKLNTIVDNTNRL